MMLDEFAHLIRQTAGQQLVGYRPAVFGHVATYDPVRHAVRCIVPSLRDADDAPLETPWLPLGSIWVGSGWGVQIAPKGGASATNPTGGEQVQIAMFDRERGVMATPCLFFTDAMLPPGGLQAGEALFRHETGTFLKFDAAGDLLMTTTAKFEVTAAGDVDVTTQGNATVTASGNASVTATGTATVTAAAVNVVAGAIKLCKALSDALQGLCTTAFATWADTHVHSNGNGGADTGTPTTSPPANALTSIVEAE